jgi:hypothetical protein
MQERCTVCAERITGSKIVLDAIDGALDDEDQVEARFSPFRDSVSVGTR